MTSIIEADVSAAVVLISMGALLGRTTPIQLLVMAVVEIVVYAANEYVQLKLLKVFPSLAGFCVQQRFSHDTCMKLMIIILL